MSMARCCDVCGTFYKEEQLNTKETYKDGRPIIHVELITYGMSTTLDLCPTCGDKLRDFLGRETACSDGINSIEEPFNKLVAKFQELAEWFY